MIGKLEGGPHDGTTFNIGEISEPREAPAIIAIDAHVYRFGAFKTRHAIKSGISIVETATYDYRGEI